MDERLKTTARSGDINALYTLIHDDPNVFKRLDELEFVDTPLHEAAVSGNTDLAMEIMNLKPSFARKLNHDGFSPIHLALLNEQTDTVTEFILVEKDLIRVKGRDGFTVLHYVAYYGHVHLLSRFLELCPDCIFDLTTRRQSALHIAAENNRFEALEALAQWIQRQFGDNDRVLQSKILNLQDKVGNTALHLAAENNQPQMIKLLVECHEIDKNKINLCGFKPSDVLQRQTAADTMESLRVLNTNSPELQTNVSGFDETVTNYVRTLKTETINALLVVLALVQTITYQAVLSPPGGVSQGGAGGSNHREGKSVMNTTDFLLFFIPNWLAFVLSWVITLSLLEGVVKSIMPFLRPLYILICFCYGAALAIISPPYVGFLPFIVPTVILILFYWTCKKYMIKHCR